MSDAMDAWLVPYPRVKPLQLMGEQSLPVRGSPQDGALPMIMSSAVNASAVLCIWVNPLKSMADHRLKVRIANTRFLDGDMCCVKEVVRGNVKDGVG